MFAFLSHIIYSRGISLDATTMARAEFTDRIIDSLKESRFSAGRRFAPEDAIRDLVTKSSFREIVPSASADLVEFVCNDAKRVFLTFWKGCRGLHDRAAEILEAFRAAQFSDSKLPIEDITTSGNCRKKEGQCTHAEVLNVFHTSCWERGDIDDFVNTQWTFIAHVFGSEAMADLHPNCILPLTFYKDHGKHGSFGSVYETAIFRGHLDSETFPEVRYGSAVDSPRRYSAN